MVKEDKMKYIAFDIFFFLTDLTFVFLAEHSPLPDRERK